MFQFLDRNSFGSDHLAFADRGVGVVVSIPRSEFFRFGPPRPSRSAPNVDVSIPRSEFFRFGRGLAALAFITTGSFNSSIGILSVRTRRLARVVCALKEFQFLDRNSFGSDEALEPVTAFISEVSIPRSEFFRFGLRRSRTEQAPLRLCFNSSIGILSVRTTSSPPASTASTSVSIPRSEFFRFGHLRQAGRWLLWRGFNSSIGILSVRTGGGCRPGLRLRCFNSSIGILSVRTSLLYASQYFVKSFQFLDRNSFGSDAYCKAMWSRLFQVSIPRSEFFRFGLRLSTATAPERTVSIPRSEFFRFGR